MKYVITVNEVFEVVFSSDKKAIKYYDKLLKKCKNDKIMLDKIYDTAFDEYIKNYDYKFLRDNSVIG